jgi:TonB family protein
LKGLSVLLNLIRTSSLLLVVLLAAAVGLAQEKKQSKKKKEEPVVVASIIKAPAEYNPASWKEYKFDAGRFSLMFPGTPQEEKQKLKAGEHEAVVHTHKVQEMAFYSVMYASEPLPAAQTPEAVRAVLDSLIKQSLAEFEGELLEQKEITLDGHPGRFIMQRLSDGLILRLKFYLVRQRLYQLMVITPSEQSATDDQRRFYAETASKFLDSFKLTPAAAAAQVGDAEIARLEALSSGAVRGETASAPPAPKPRPRAPISGGILNGKAVSKPNPAYPAAAKQAGIKGTVEVAVVVDEEGKVISAEALSGPVELREAAVAAARQARFSQTRLSGQLVKISGRLVYNFGLR